MSLKLYCHTTVSVKPYPVSILLYLIRVVCQVGLGIWCAGREWDKKAGLKEQKAGRGVLMILSSDWLKLKQILRHSKSVHAKKMAALPKISLISSTRELDSRAPGVLMSMLMVSHTEES